MFSPYSFTDCLKPFEVLQYPLLHFLLVALWSSTRWRFCPLKASGVRQVHGAHQARMGANWFPADTHCRYADMASAHSSPRSPSLVPRLKSLHQQEQEHVTTAFLFCTPPWSLAPLRHHFSAHWGTSSWALTARTSAFSVHLILQKELHQSISTELLHCVLMLSYQPTSFETQWTKTRYKI